MNYSGEEVISKISIDVENYLPDIGIDKVREEILQGLKSMPKYISPKYFYDEQGSKLFEAITDLEEYYPTRTEKSILRGIVSKLELDFTKLHVIELGSGDNSKIRLVLNQIPDDILTGMYYYPVDISQSAIESSAESLQEEFPGLRITGIVADFMHQLNQLPKGGNRLFCFFGSTIGNFNLSERKRFLQMLGAEMQSGDSLLLGLDMVKDISILEAAYNDSKQVTARFNKNILNVVNSLVEADFNPDEFEHWAFFNDEFNRIEMHLKALKDINVHFSTSNNTIHLKKGETIHTENSHKFTPMQISSIALWGKLSVQAIYSDKNKWFSLVHYKKV